MAAWIFLLVVLVLLFGWSLTVAGLIWIVKVLLLVAAVVVLARIIRGDRNPL